MWVRFPPPDPIRKEGSLSRRPYKNRAVEYLRARNLRMEGFGYRTIAQKLGISWGTIKNWVSDIPAPEAHKLAQAKKRKTRAADCQHRSTVRNFLIRNRGYKCEECGISEWRDQRIPLEVEHCDGNKNNHADDNVKLLCPNCHSLTPTWRRKKRGRSKTVKQRP